MQQKQIPASNVLAKRILKRRESRTNPEEASVVAPIPSSGIKHVWRENAADYTDDVATPY